ncbi:MAG: HlyD family type I secretion periplasmic adaptor subunit [Rhodospirillales bacterium]|jgi:HlyD family type I secretion membrane fusion protein|nr:HlyD family type I secretion periplasmic adaptor subunit [Rhodospirillales bacterium]MDP6645161.1 HlyD family type I secretion periplasmic adaptor subunit [Rhodospirillales bacterium]MDP6843109.1 HlyD family type I secretion periplasmic adaptor subunit [Rhodospirillales bacterium]|tara:strand:+ start:702 stop:2102 length:1401 start_codon:yes stop_codon:yes gene_type:complete
MKFSEEVLYRRMVRDAVKRLAQLRRNRRRSKEISDLALLVRRWQIFGSLLIIGFIGGGFFWAANAEVDGAAIAPGVVSVESHRKDIQHLEGGIIREILVREGDRVEKGQVLAYLDDTKARTQLDLLTHQWRSALITRARLTAERNGWSDLRIPAAIETQKGNPKIRALIKAQRAALYARRGYVKNQTDILKLRIERLRREAKGYSGKVASNRAQLRLLDEEITPLAKLLGDGLVVKSKFMALKRKAEFVRGEISEFAAKVEAAKRNMEEIRSQLTLPATNRSNEIASELEHIENRLGDLRERMAAARDVQERTLIVAPDDGTIVDLGIHTRGGVIQPGQRLMSLVPAGDKLVIDARVHPRDRDIIYSGMKARIRLTAFSSRQYSPIQGVVTAISADKLTDPNTGSIYFKARIEPRNRPKKTAGRGAIGALMPGMLAEVFLVTGSRTVLDYLLSPIVSNFEHAGRES